jgi:hypothetical protein
MTTETNTRTWTIHVINKVTGKGQAGADVALSPGSYTMTELTDIMYAISTGESLVAKLLLSQVATYRRAGALVIDGAWP